MLNPQPLLTLRTGIPEFDVILGGGLPRDRLHLLEGAPGSGKTSIALRFLMEGVAVGERCLYVTLSETVEELTTSARSHGWSLEGIEFFELVPAEAAIENHQTVLYPAEAEFSDTMRQITERIGASAPDRLVVDSLADLRLLAQDALPYRRQLLILKQYLQGRDITALVLDDLTGRTAAASCTALSTALSPWSRSSGTMARPAAACGSPRCGEPITRAAGTTSPW